MQVNGVTWNDDLCIKWGLHEYCKNTADHMLDFTARVPMMHNEQIEDCIYFRVETVTFPEKSIVPFCNKTISTKHCHVRVISMRMCEKIITQ